MTILTSGPNGDAIVVEAVFPVRPSRVFRAWTDPAEIKKWFGSNPGALESAVIDLRPGGEWRFTEHQSGAGSVGFEGEYIEVEQDRALVFSWSKFTEDAAGQRTTSDSSRVDVRFSETDDGTRMKLVHSAVEDAGVRTDFARGWGRAVPNLAAVLVAS